VAAPFTGGTSLALIGAGAGAAKGALSGGAKGALTGAAIGAGTSALGGGPAGANAARGMAGAVKESASSAIKRAILNPRALTQLGGAAVGGRTEQLAQLAAPFLRGAKAFTSPPTPTDQGYANLAQYQKQLAESGIKFGPLPRVSADADYNEARDTAQWPVDWRKTDWQGPMPPTQWQEYQRQLGDIRNSIAKQDLDSWTANKVMNASPGPEGSTKMRHPDIDKPLGQKPLWKWMGNWFFGPPPESYGERTTSRPQMQNRSSRTSSVISASPRVSNKHMYENLLYNTALQHGIDPNLFMTLAKQESAFNPSAVSPKGAVGLTQIMPKTGAEILWGNQWQKIYDTPEGQRELTARLQNPVTNAAMGAQYFKKILQQFNNDPELALAAYNAGAGRIQNVLAGRDSLPPETQNYIRKILGRPVAWHKFRSSPSIGGQE